MSRPDLAAQLHALADRLAELEPAQIVGELEALRVVAFQDAITPPPPAPGPSRALDVAAVVARTGLSRDWLYRQARLGHLPFARKIGRRFVFEDGLLERWMARRTVATPRPSAVAPQQRRPARRVPSR